MNLRERVEDGAGRLVELHRAADLERAREHLFGALEIAELHENLAERRQRHGEAVTGAERFVQRDAALGERQRLIVLMAHQRDVRLVVDDPRQHVVGRNRHREPFALSQGGGGLVVAAGLREQHGRERVDEREVTPVAGGVERRSGFRQVVADDAGVADLLVAERQLVVGEADGARVVRELGVLQRARVQRDRARLLAARKGEAAVQPPERREARVGERLAHRVGRAAERRSGLGQVVLQQPRGCERRTHGDLVVAC